jgi:hypothetical protein
MLMVMPFAKTMTATAIMTALCSAGVAQAGWMAVDALAPYGNTMSQGGDINGQFDIEPLVSGGSYVQPYVISQAVIRFAFDERSVESLMSTSTGGYYTTGGSYYGGYQYARTEQQNFYNPYDEVTAYAPGTAPTSAGNGSGGYSYSMYGSTTFDFSQSRQSGTGSYSYSCGWWSTCYASYPIYATDSYYTEHDSQHSGYTGDILFDMPIYPQGLDDLAADGILPFSIHVNSGAVALTQAQLLFDIYPNAPEPQLLRSFSPTAADVPEPGTLASLGLGLAALAWMRRRRRPPE